MRHLKHGRKLGRNTAHRKALFKNLMSELIKHERIITTLAKAKEVRPLMEKLITRGKKGTVHDRRMVRRWIEDRTLIKKLFDEIAPRFQNRNGGYLRIVKLGFRRGDAAEMAILEFVDFSLPSEEEGEEEKKGDKS